MRYWVIDSETTGVGDEDRAVEVGGVYCEGNEIIDAYSTLVDPGIPIPPIASAIHHITDEDVKGKPSIEDAMVPFFDREFDFVVAHNAKFDKRFMDFGEAPWVCTWKLSLIVFPDAPSHGNQVLRYYLGLEKPQLADVNTAHRVLYDAEVTARLFQRIMTKATSDDFVSKMIDLSDKPALLRKCNFGKHNGKLWKDVPRDYLDYILNKSSGWDENIVYTARYYYDRR
jgi:exodeoxyribonuclease X